MSKSTPQEAEVMSQQKQTTAQVAAKKAPKASPKNSEAAGDPAARKRARQQAAAIPAPVLKKQATKTTSAQYETVGVGLISVPTARMVTGRPIVPETKLPAEREAPTPVEKMVKLGAVEESKYEIWLAQLNQIVDADDEALVKAAADKPKAKAKSTSSAPKKDEAYRALMLDALSWKKGVAQAAGFSLEVKQIDPQKKSSGFAWSVTEGDKVVAANVSPTEAGGQRAASRAARAHKKGQKQQVVLPQPPVAAAAAA
jgi:hypothetical protein